MTASFVSWMVWIAGMCGVAVGFSLGCRWGGRRGGPTWKKAFGLGGAVGLESVAEVMAANPGKIGAEHCNWAAAEIRERVSK